MSCECNETSFNKLRESWSRHHKKGTQAQCECCRSGLRSKSKVKGRFGVAYVIDTPVRKCKPCGWEVEFTDTLSEVENNCKKMMNWVTCPPLGECQNNQTNMCCCSEDAKEFFNNIQPTCCQCEEKVDELCPCCKQRTRKNDGESCKKEKQRISCCCDKPITKNQCLCSKLNENKGQCCSRATDNKKQCCCRVSDNKNRGCLNSKPNSSCCRYKNGQTMYLESKKRCAECCCLISNKEKNKQCCCKPQKDDSYEDCCCKTTKMKSNCCCEDSDSQSSLDFCKCEKCTKTNDSACNCNCSGCKCNDRNKRGKRKKEQHEEHKKSENTHSKESRGSKDKAYTKPKPSKNLLSPEPKKERYKSNEKTPFTISTHGEPKKEPDKSGDQQPKDFTISTYEEPKKEPDKGQDQHLKDFYNELNQKVLGINKPEESVKVIVDPENSQSEYNSRNSLENGEHLPSKSDLNEYVIVENESELKSIDYEDKNLGTNKGQDKIANTENILNDDTNKENIVKRARKKPTLLQRIKREHKKEMDAIHPKQSKDPNLTENTGGSPYVMV